jgi:hypothetical protein
MQGSTLYIGEDVIIPTPNALSISQAKRNHDAKFYQKEYTNAHFRDGVGKEVIPEHDSVWPVGNAWTSTAPICIFDFPQQPI